MPRCYSCNGEVVVSDRVGRNETCPQCNADLHCCRNCRFYDPASYNECREPQAERVVAKEPANFCDYFEPAETPRSLKQGDAAAARQKLEGLFKRK